MATNKWNDAEVIKRIKQRVVDRLILVGEFVAGDAKLRCPVDLGNLRESIFYKVDENKLSVIIGTNVEYAIYIEFGTGEKAEDGNGKKGGWFYVTDYKQAKGFLLGQTKNGKYLYFTYGSKPQPFLRPALIENKEAIKTILNIAA